MVTKLCCLHRAMASSELTADIKSDQKSTGKRAASTELQKKKTTATQVRQPSGVSLTGLINSEPEPKQSLFMKNMEKNKLGVVGIGLWGAIVAFFLIRVRKRKTSLSTYLIQLRMFAQIACIGCIAGGAAYGSWSKDKK